MKVNPDIEFSVERSTRGILPLCSKRSPCKSNTHCSIYAYTAAAALSLLIQITRLRGYSLSLPEQKLFQRRVRAAHKALPRERAYIHTNQSSVLILSRAHIFHAKANRPRARGSRGRRIMVHNRTRLIVQPPVSQNARV